MHVVPTLLLCAGTLGCAGASGADTSRAADDTGVPTGDSDTACEDTGMDAAAVALAVRADALAALPSGACGALIDPWVPNEADDAMRVWALALNHTWRNGIDADFGTCPCAAPTDCTSSTGWTTVGEWEGGGSSRGAGWMTYTAWGRVYDSPDGRHDRLAHGSGTDGGGGGATNRTFTDDRESLAHTGLFDHAGNGTRIRDGRLSTTNGWPGSLDGLYIYVVEDDTLATGDLCLEYALEVVEACAQEPTGTFRIVGAQEMTVTFDGDVACDGCGTLDVDGVEAGAFCDPVRTWAG